MDWIPLQYIAVRDLGKIIRVHPLCIFILFRSGCNPLAQTILEHFYLFMTVTTLCCQACKALPGSGLDLTLTSSSLRVDSAPYSPPQHGSYWKTWRTLFSILSSGGTESFNCCFPAIQEQDYGCSFHTYLADSFLLSSICCLTFLSLLHVSNQQLTHGGFLPVRGSEHGISCRGSVPHRWLPLMLFVAVSRTFVPV